MGLPVVTVASGGLPIVESTVGGTPVTEAANGRGVPVTKVVGKPGLPVVFETIGVAAPVTYATFELASVSNTTLSGGNLTATHANTTTNAGARVIPVKSSGKYYFEIVLTIGNGAFDCMGLMTSTATYAQFCVSAQNGCINVTRGAGNININNVFTSKALGLFAPGNVLGVAVDLDARLVWCRRGAGNWNADVAANPATGTNGLAFPGATSVAPAVGFAGTGTATNDAYVANFGASAFVGAVPAGFTSGWPA